MIFITNHPKPFESFWPRRKDVVYFVGEPRECSDAFPKEKLDELGYIGIYAEAETHDEYYGKELIKAPEK